MAAIPVKAWSVMTVMTSVHMTNALMANVSFTQWEKAWVAGEENAVMESAAPGAGLVPNV